MEDNILKFDPKKPVHCFEHGHYYPARILCTDCIHFTNALIVALVMFDGQSEQVCEFFPDGTGKHGRRLENKKVKKWRWVVGGMTIEITEGHYATAEEAAKEGDYPSTMYVHGRILESEIEE